MRKTSKKIEVSEADRPEYIRNPVIAEFLGLELHTNTNELKLETAILDNLQKENLRSVITDQIKFVSVMMVNNEIGTIQPIKELCGLAHEYGALFHTDAVQAVGHIPINVHELGADFLSSSAHKFSGPKGIGFLYICKGAKIEPFSDGGAQEFGMRAGTENIVSIVGMAAALKKNCSQMEAIGTHLLEPENIILGAMDASSIVYQRNGGDPHINGGAVYMGTKKQVSGQLKILDGLLWIWKRCAVIP